MARTAGARARQVADAVARLSAPDQIPGGPLGLAAVIVGLIDAGAAVDKADLALASRALCEWYGGQRGGRTVELRVPPYAAVQLAASGEAGSTHTRGTPPNVVETDPETLLRLASGSVAWDDAVRSRKVRLSGVHADVSDLFRTD